MSLLLRRRMLIANSENEQIILPEVYQRVKYIESTGKQFIDTGVSPTTDDTEVYIKFENSVVDTQYRNLFGGAVTGRYANLFFYNGKIYASNNYNNTTPIGNIVYSTDKINECTLSLIGGTGVLNLNGKTVTNSYTTNNSTIKYYLFTCRAQGGVQTPCSAKVYRCYIKKNNNFIRDFIPCYRKSDNIIGMYDIVYGVFYTNQGTDTFIKGADI